MLSAVLAAIPHYTTAAACKLPKQLDVSLSGSTDVGLIVAGSCSPDSLSPSCSSSARSEELRNM